MNSELEREIKHQYDAIARQCENILKDEIQHNLYDVYTPKEYVRTYQLLENVRTEIRDDTLYLYINTGNMHYESVSGKDITSQVPYWINYGHNIEDRGGAYMFDYYPSRSFIENAKRRIENELGIEVEIMSDFKEI